MITDEGRAELDTKLLTNKTWEATFPNGFILEVKAQNRKEAIHLLPTFRLTLSCFKSFKRKDNLTEIERHRQRIAKSVKGV